MKFLFSFLFIPFFSFAQIDTSFHYDVLDLMNKDLIGKPYPEFSINNQTIKLSTEDIKGKVVLINCWFQSCPPCMAEMEALTNLYEKYKHNNSFVFISLTTDNKEIIKEVKTKYKINYPIFSLHKEECEKLRLNNGFPTTIVLNNKSIIQPISWGGSSDKDKATKMINSEIEPELLKYLDK